MVSSSRFRLSSFVSVACVLCAVPPPAHLTAQGAATQVTDLNQSVLVGSSSPTSSFTIGATTYMSVLESSLGR